MQTTYIKYIIFEWAETGAEPMAIASRDMMLENEYSIPSGILQYLHSLSAQIEREYYYV